MHIFGLLCITRVYAKPECTPMKYAKCVGKTRVLVQTKMHECSSYKPKCTGAVCANQKCTHAFCANHDAHSRRLTSHVYTHALNVHFYVIDLLCTCRLCFEYFQKRVELCSCLVCVVKFKLSCNICTYVRMYVCMYIYIYVCTYVCMYVCMLCMYGTAQR